MFGLEPRTKQKIACTTTAYMREAGGHVVHVDREYIDYTRVVMETPHGTSVMCLDTHLLGDPEYHTCEN